MYYLIYALAKVTGSNAPDRIAYSSQFTDDNNEGQFSVDGSDVFFPEKLKANGGILLSDHDTVSFPQIP